MTFSPVTEQIKQEKISRRSVDELGYMLYHCWDLPVLQTSDLVNLPNVKKRSEEEKQGLSLARALRKELIFCAEQITQRQRYPIEDIVNAIEKANMNLGSHDVVKIQRTVGIPFSRKRLDLARYYTIRLIMQGVDQHTIAEFLDVDLRTVANYIAQAKERIRLILETRSIFE